MNRTLLTILTVISISSFGQQWSEYQVDSTLTLLLPDNYEVRDTLGQHIIKSTIDNGLIIVSVVPISGRTINVKSEDGLIKWYKDFVKGFIPPNGELIKDEIIENSGLKMIRLSYNATMADVRQIRHTMAVFIDEKIYSVNFWEPESMTTQMTKTREQLFSSLRFPTNVGLNNQMSHRMEVSREMYYGALTRKLFDYILLPGLIILVIVWIIKKVRRRSTNAQK